MGFTIFESSGTFTPSDYGLKAGDYIHIICVGGGGGGWASSNNINYYKGDTVAATAGSASSFGSIVSASGGACGTSSKSTANTRKGSTGTLEFASNNYYAIGGHGADGFILGEVNTRNALTPVYRQIMSTDYSTGITYSNNASFGKKQYTNSMSPTTDYLASTIPQGNYGSAYVSDNNYPTYYLTGPGGDGYGSGGGALLVICDNSVESGYGGNAGSIVHKDYVLSNTNSIAVTVGNGGNGGYKTSSGLIALSGGGGARGCVCVFW